MNSIKSLQKKKDQIISKIKSFDNLMKGSVYFLKRKCTNPNCSCILKGKLHQSFVLTYSKGGKTKILSLKKEQGSDVKKLTKNYNKIKKLLLQLTDINVEIIKAEKKIGKNEKTNNAKKTK